MAASSSELLAAWNGRDLFQDLDGYLLHRLLDYLPACGQMTMASVCTRFRSAVQSRLPLAVEKLVLYDDSVSVLCDSGSSCKCGKLHQCYHRQLSTCTLFTKIGIRKIALLQPRQYSDHETQWVMCCEDIHIYLGSHTTTLSFYHTWLRPNTVKEILKLINHCKNLQSPRITLKLLSNAFPPANYPVLDGDFLGQSLARNTHLAKVYISTALDIECAERRCVMKHSAVVLPLTSPLEPHKDKDMGPLVYFFWAQPLILAAFTHGLFTNPLGPDYFEINVAPYSDTFEDYFILGHLNTHDDYRHALLEAMDSWCTSPRNLHYVDKACPMAFFNGQPDWEHELNDWVASFSERNGPFVSCRTTCTPYGLFIICHYFPDGRHLPSKCLLQVSLWYRENPFPVDPSP